MLHLLFQSIETSLGPSLAGAAQLIYWSSLLVLLMVGGAALYRLWRDYHLLKAGLSQRWVMACPHCRRIALITAGRCDYCEATIPLPWILKRLTSARWPGHSTIIRHLRLVGRLLGVGLFIVLTLWLLQNLSAFTPEGAVHQLLIGVSVLAWIALWWSTARALRLQIDSVAGRLSDVVLAVAAMGALIVALFLTDAAQSRHDSSVAHVTAAGNHVQLGAHVISVPEGEVTLEYLQVDHDLLGYHRIIALALVGGERASLLHSPVERWLVEHLTAVRGRPDSTGAGGPAGRGACARRSRRGVRLHSRDGTVRVQRAGLT